MTTDEGTPANDFEESAIFVGDEPEMVQRENEALARGDHMTALASTMVRVSTRAWEVLISAGLVDQSEMVRWTSASPESSRGDAIPALYERAEKQFPGNAPRALAVDASIRVIATCDDVRETLQEIVDLMKQVEAGEDDVTINADLFVQVAFWGAALGSASERLNAVLKGVYDAPAELQFTRERNSHGGHITTAKSRARRDVHKRHVVELAKERLRAPLPTGRAKWTASLIAGEVTSAWKLDGVQPMPSTIQAMVKEAVSDRQIVLPG